MGATEILLSTFVLFAASADEDGYNVGKLNYGGRHMNYYEGETVPIAWSDPDGCGQECEIILQSKCDPLGSQDTGKGKGKGISALRGASAQSEQIEPAEAASSRPLLFEPTACQTNSDTRERNVGLFAVDQNSRDEARERNNYTPDQPSWEVECSEEREYYPYWRPSEWVDMAYITEDEQKCESYRANSANSVGQRGFCRGASEALTESECTARNGKWLVVQATQATPPPPCLSSEATRPNHLGLIGGPKQRMYNWAVPSIFQGIDEAYDTVRCVLRIRYNITSDYDPQHRIGFHIDEQRVEVDFTKRPLSKSWAPIFP